jgi:hypothetical protein
MVASEDFGEKIIDFLYIDQKKTEMLADQILGDSAAETRSTKRTTTGKRSLAIKAGLDALGGNVSGESSQSITEALTHNTYWRNAKALIEILRASEAPTLDPGSLCHLTGNLMMLDLTFVRNLNIETDDLDPVFHLLKVLNLLEPMKLTLNGNKVRNLSADQTNALLKSMATIAIKLAQRWPSRVVGIFETHRGAFWFTMSETSIQQEYKDSLLRYRGVYVPGIWNMVAIIDAKPSESLEKTFADGRKIAAELLPESRRLQSLTNGLYGIGGLFLGMENHMSTAMPVILYRQLKF